MRLGTLTGVGGLMPAWDEVLAIGSVVCASTGLAKLPRCWRTGPKSFLSCSNLAFLFSFLLAFCFSACNLLDFELGGLSLREILLLLCSSWDSSRVLCRTLTRYTLNHLTNFDDLICTRFVRVRLVPLCVNTGKSTQNHYDLCKLTYQPRRCF